MANQKQQIVTLTKIRHCSDWFTKQEVEVDLNAWFLELQYRLGSWHLMHFKIEDGKKVSAHINNFELMRPHHEIGLIHHRIRAYTDLHHSPDFAKELSKLLNSAMRAK